jgi:hypothetical protein
MEDAGTRSGMPTEGNNDGGTSENTGGINGNAQITQHIFDYDSGIGSHIRFLATSNLIIADSLPVFYAVQDDDDDDGDDDDDDDDSYLERYDVDEWLMMFAPNYPYNKEVMKRRQLQREQDLHAWLNLCEILCLGEKKMAFGFLNIHSAEIDAWYRDFVPGKKAFGL